MFIGRKSDGTIFGTSAIRQAWTTEELPDDHPEVVAYRTRPRRKPTVAQVFASLGITLEELKAALASR